jgi:hypothetical protein
LSFLVVAPLKKIKIAGSSQDVAKGVNVSYELSDFDVNTDIII